MAPISNRSSGDWSPQIWAAGASWELTAGPRNDGWPSPIQSAIACEASMHIKERNREVYSTTKNGGCGSLRTPKGRKVLNATYFTGDEKPASPRSTCAHAQ